MEVATAEAIQKAAESQAAALRDRGAEIERARRLPEPFVRAFDDAGPLPALPAAFARRTRTLARRTRARARDARRGRRRRRLVRDDRVDHGCVAPTWLDPAAARELFSAPGAITGGVFAPSGRATRAAAASASPAAGRFAQRLPALHVVDGRRDRRRRRQARTARRRRVPTSGSCFFPAEEAEILDTWTRRRAARHRQPRHRGRATCVVPRRARRVADQRPPARDAARSTPSRSSACSRSASPASRSASRRRAIDELVALAGDKTPDAGAEAARGERARMQVAAGAGRGGAARGARRSCSPAIDDVWRRVEAGGAVSHRGPRARSGSPPRTRCAAPRRAVDPMYERGGGTAIYADEPAPALLPRRARRHAARAGRARAASNSRAACCSASTPTTRCCDRLGSHRFEALRIVRRRRGRRDHDRSPDERAERRRRPLHDELTRLFGALRARDRGARRAAHRLEARLLRGRRLRLVSRAAGRRLAKLDPLRRDAKQLIWDLLDVEMPIVAALNGPAVGLGASIALLCDVIFMADTASIADPHVRVGIVAGDGGAAIWPLVLGPARAKEFLLTGDTVEAAEALRMGLVNRVVPRRRALPRRAPSPTGSPPVRRSRSATRRWPSTSWSRRPPTSPSTTRPRSRCVTFQSEDHREALAAMREKRKPVFKGR